MSEKNQTVEDMLIQFAAESKGQEPQAEQPIQDTQPEATETPQEAEPVEDTTTDAIETQAVESGTEVAETTEVPVEEEQVDQIDNVSEEEDDDDDIDLFDLDFDEDDQADNTTTVEVPQIDYSDIGKAIGENITSEAELISKFSELKAKNEELQQAVASSQEFAGLDADLAKAIEIAQQGGDYKSFLGLTSVDYANIDPVELFEYEAAQLFTDEKGNFDEAAYTEALEGFSDEAKKFEGLKLKRQRQAEQAQAKQQYEANIKAQKQLADQQLQKAVSDLNSVAGFKVTPAIKKNLFDAISTGKAVQDMFYDSEGNYDFNKISENYFKIKHFDKMLNFHKQRAKTSAKKEVIDDLTNPEIKSPAKPANPEAPAPKTGIDAWKEQFGIDY